MRTDIRKYFDCLKLNLRVGHLALARQWLSKEDFAASYDRLALQYDNAWLVHLRSVTEKLLEHLPPGIPSGRILDLGCGTGYTTEFLAEQYAGSPLTALDISENMLNQARQRQDWQNTTEWVCADMLDYLNAQPSDSAALVVSGWAIGYSRPSRVLKETARIVQKGGRVAFVVNYADTLRPVMKAFRTCMARFPEQMQRAYIPYFPRNWRHVQSMLKRCGFHIQWREEGEQIIVPPETTASQGLLPWLLNTGVLAGFDQMLPLRAEPRIAEYFEEQLRCSEEPITHHYIAVIAEL